MKYFISLALFIFLLSTTFVKSDDLSIDLGRHIASGKIIVDAHYIPAINYFSYTQPNYPFINHYWLTEVVFFSLQAIFGLTALFYLKEVIIFLSVGIILYYSFKKQGAFASGLASLLVFPFFIVRNVIRPELFGYLFFSVLFILLLNYPRSKKYILLVPFIMLLWVNLSITFVFGIFIILIFLLNIFYKETSQLSIQTYDKLVNAIRRKDSIFLLLSLGVVLINPQGIQGVIAPLSILKTPVYHLTEMENIFTVLKISPHPIYTYISYIMFLTPILCVYLFLRKKFLVCIFLTVFLITAVLQNRNIIFFALVFIPSFAFAIEEVCRKLLKFTQYSEKIKTMSGFLLVFIIILLSIPFLNNSFYKTFDIKESFGQGFYEDASSAVEFMKKNKLPKNVFNNFNISGYFIFRTYPVYKPFIDNRPEAYSSNFFENVYLSVFKTNMQMKKVFDSYNIQTVFLQLDSGDQDARRLATALHKDNKWRLAYLDNSVIIYTKGVFVKDIKNDLTFLEVQIDKGEDYLKLGKLASNFSLIGYSVLAEIALKKAETLNPNSCNIKRLYYEYYIKTGLNTEAKAAKSNNWHCFFYM